MHKASQERRNKIKCDFFSQLYVLVNIAAINSNKLKGKSNVLIQTEVVKPVHDLRAGEL